MTRSSDPSAELARRCISSLLGVHAESWDLPPRHGAYDLRYERGGKTVAVEVKLLVDAGYRAAQTEASKAGYVTCTDLSRSWTVDLDHTASWKNARLALPRLLTELEDLRWPGGGNFWRLRGVASGLRARIEELGVESAWPIAPTEMHPPGFYLMPAGWGGGVPGIDALPEFVEEQLASESMSKLHRQLAAADTDERHAFFVVGWEHMIIGALTDASEALPTSAPNLAEGIDAVWVTPITIGSRVVAWLPDEGWMHAPAPAKDAPPPAAADDRADQDEQDPSGGQPQP
jgi:hypothetical protein